MSYWKEKEILFLKENYQKTSYITISKELNRSIQSVYWKAFELGLNKGRWNDQNTLNKTKVINLLRDYFEKYKKSPSSREVSIAIKSACQRHFGSFNEAKKAAKLTIREPLKILNKKAYKPSDELAYLVGLLLGDGSFRYQKTKERTSYVIVYASKDKDLVDFFLNKFEKWSGYNYSNIYTMKEREKISKNGKRYLSRKAYMVQIGFKDAWFFLKQFKSNPLTCLNFFNEKQQRWLLKGLWDAEGCIRIANSKYLRIHFSNKNKEIITLYRKILNNFNLDNSINISKDCFNVDILGKEDHKIKFINLIHGITINRKLNKLAIYLNEKKL